MKKFLFLMLIPTMVSAQQTINGLNIKGKLDVISTTKSSNPCPSMTEAQRDLIIVPTTGSCVYNTSALSLNIYDGAEWKSAGGGGISLWLTLTNYKTDDVVIDSNKIYKSLSDHTSGTFATDLLNGDWVEISANDPLVLTGEATNVGSVVTLDNDAVTGKELTGFTSGAGLITATDSILEAFQKADGNTNAKLGNTQSNVDVSPVATTQLNTPASQLTNVGTNTRLIETGNTNLLANPGFESATVPTCTTGTPTLDAVTFFPGGKQSMKLAVTGTGGRCVFSIPSGTAAMLKGQQMFLRARINSTDSALKVCSVENGVDKNCKDVAVTSVNRLWDTVEIPFIADGTSNGLVIKTMTTSAQSIYVDDLVISTGLPNLVGLAGDTVYSANISSTGVISNLSPAGWLSGNCTYSPGIADCPVKSGLITTAMNCTVVQSQLGNADRYNYQYASSSANKVVFTDQTGASTRALSVICTKGTADYANASSSAYLSKNGNFGPINAGTVTVGATTTAPTKGTIVADTIQASRFGSRLVADFNFQQSSAGSSGSGDYLYSLPIVNGVQLQFDSSVFFHAGTNIQAAAARAYVGSGRINDNATATLNVQLIAYDSTRFRAIAAYGSSGAFVSSGNFQMSGAAYGFGFHIDAPIQGWTNSNLIVGSFEGIEKCANAYECTDTFSAQVSNTGIVTGENIDWINGNCTNSSGLSTCTFNTGIFTVYPNCFVSNGETGTNRYINVLPTSTNVLTQLYNSAGTGSSTAYQITCQKQGADYKPKTAKIASSIGVPTVPESTAREVIYSGYVPSATNIPTNERGNMINGNCTYASNKYTCPLTITHTSKLNCTCSASEAPTAASIICNYDAINSTASSAMFWTTGNGVLSARDFSFQCHGAY